MEEATRFESWERWRDYVLYEEEGDVGEYNAELEANLDTDARVNAWFKTFHEDAVKAMNSQAYTGTDTLKADSQGGSQGTFEGSSEGTRGTPAELDREFLDTVKDAEDFDAFIERAAAIYNNEFREEAVDEAFEEDGEYQRIRDEDTREREQAQRGKLQTGGTDDRGSGAGSKRTDGEG